MKPQNILASTLLFAGLTAYAFAGEQGTINQANPLDETMRFYLHPAHLYLSSEAPHPLGEHPAVLVKRSEAQNEGPAVATIHPHPALIGRGGEPGMVMQSAAGLAYP